MYMIYTYILVFIVVIYTYIVLNVLLDKYVSNNALKIHTADHNLYFTYLILLITCKWSGV